MEHIAKHQFRYSTCNLAPTSLAFHLIAAGCIYLDERGVRFNRHPFARGQGRQRRFVGGIRWLLAFVVVAGHYLSRPVFRLIAASKLREIFTAAALLLPAW